MPTVLEKGLLAILPAQPQILCDRIYTERPIYSSLKFTNLPQLMVLRYSGYHRLVSEVEKGCTKGHV